MPGKSGSNVNVSGRLTALNAGERSACQICRRLRCPDIAARQERSGAPSCSNGVMPAGNNRRPPFSDEQGLPFGRDDTDDVLLHLDEAERAGSVQRSMHRPVTDERLIRDGVDRERAMSEIPALLPYGTPMVREARPAANSVVEIFHRLAVRSRTP